MVGMRISELARRSGVPATTLRFYEQQGLLPAGRTDAGYRVYDDAAVDRLGFVAVAKRLGLALDEIARLLRPWQDGGCRDVRAELMPLIEERIRETRERTAELQAVARELDAARRHLATIDRDGPCDRSCSFRQDPTAGLRLRTLPLEADRDADAAVIACSLPPAERDSRVERWRAVLGAVARRHEIPGGLRIEFDPGRVEVAELARLLAAEAECCRFLDLRLCFTPEPVLEARAPDEAAVVLEDLFGAPTP